jgi:hypothetical protein
VAKLLGQELQRGLNRAAQPRVRATVHDLDVGSDRLAARRLLEGAEEVVGAVRERRVGEDDDRRIEQVDQPCRAGAELGRGAREQRVDPRVAKELDRMPAPMPCSRRTSTASS